MQNNSGIWPLPLPTSLFDMQPNRLGTAFLSHHPLTQNTSSNISASTLSLEKLPDPWSWNQETAHVL